MQTTTVIRRDIVTKRVEASAATDRLLCAMGEAGDWFKQSSAAFFEADFVVQRVLGAPGKEVMDYIDTRNGGYARSGDYYKQASAVDWTQAPYCLIKNCVDLARDVVHKNRDYQKFAAEAAKQAEDLLAPFDCAPLASVLTGAEEEKTSSMGALLTGVFGKSLLDGAKGGQPTPEQKIQGMAGDLADPDHESEMRQIQTKALLQDLLQNDEVISGYDPNEVIGAYNEMAKLSPASAIQPALVRPFLRKRMTQGAIEPFEAAEIADVEKTITQTRNPGGFEQKVGNVLRKSVLTR